MTVWCFPVSLGVIYFWVPWMAKSKKTHPEGAFSILLRRKMFNLTPERSDHMGPCLIND